MISLGLAQLHRPELRESYTDQVVARLYAAATGVGGDGSTLAAVETAARWWGSGLASATVTPSNIPLRSVTPTFLDCVGRSLCRSGESLHVIEMSYLWRAIVAQTRRIIVDGHLPTILEIEPVSSVVSLTRWTSTDAAVVVPASTFSVVTRNPAGTTISLSPGSAWPDPERTIGSFALTYMAGWDVSATENNVPASI